MLGDGIATMLASFIGGPPNTTYSEVTGAVALTRAFNPGVMTWAAIWAIVLSCVNKLGAFLSSIPVPVMGGIMILLFGAIMVVGLNTLVRAGEDLIEPRNLAVVALIIISLRLKLGGKLRVVLCSRHFINNQSVRAVLAEKCAERIPCRPPPPGADWHAVFLSLQALGGYRLLRRRIVRCRLKGCYAVKIGVDICTTSAGSRSLWATLPACAAIF